MPSRSIPRPFGTSPTDGSLNYLTTQDLVELHRGVSREFGGHQASPGMVDSPYGLTNAVQRPQTTVFGRDAYPTFAEKATAFLFALLSHRPFHSGNRRVALTSLIAFCEMNNRQIDARTLDEKGIESLIKKTANSLSQTVPAENLFRDVREVLARAIVQISPNG